jgi:hypothetical protein
MVWYVIHGAKLDLVRLGLVWSGLVWFGLAICCGWYHIGYGMALKKRIVILVTSFHYLHPVRVLYVMLGLAVLYPGRSHLRIAGCDMCGGTAVGVHIRPCANMCTQMCTGMVISISTLECGS